MRLMKKRLSLEEYVEGIKSGNRIVLAQAITLVESTLPSDVEQANELLNALVALPSDSFRIGITGAPGVGKSTFIEALGRHVTSLGKKLAVLSVDPSSQLTKGSILGDKTRMEDLSRNPMAFIRPSASGNSLGGVSGKTREVILLCEAAGFKVIIVETVGVGQSEVAVKNMVDFFLLLMLPGAGDELQGIKKGIMEMADALMITKADGDTIKQAKKAQAEYQHALELFQPPDSRWKPRVSVCSALTNTGIDGAWKMMDEYRQQTEQNGFFYLNRKKQSISWFHESVDTLIRSDFLRFGNLKETFRLLEKRVLARELSPNAAALQARNAYYDAIKGNNS